MAWRHGRSVVEHRLPLGATRRPVVGEAVRAGDVLASGTSLGSPVRVDGAERVGVEGADVGHVARVQVGANVEPGTVLARTGRRFARAVTAPIAGRLVHRSAGGSFYIAPVTGTWRVCAAMDGVVTRSDDASVSVEGVAWSLPGIAAYGPDAIGELALGVDAPTDELAPGRVDVRLRGTILIGGARIAAEAITRAHACGVAGLVAGAAPAGGLRVVYGDEVTAFGGPTFEDRPTVLCLIGFGSGPLPREIYLPLVAFSGNRAAIHVASGRLFVFAPAAALDSEGDVPALVLAGDFGGVRPLEGRTSLTGTTRFASDVFCEGFATDLGVVPVPNVLPFDAAR
ncbi:MAG TPA: hypothetical protein VHG53_00860 [Candidatus Limnocylindria bacterium]|nr:hypothetical protein [Candidatus Limnocylindria bacterium]